MAQANYQSARVRADLSLVPPTNEGRGQTEAYPSATRGKGGLHARECRLAGTVAGRLSTLTSAYANEAQQLAGGWPEPVPLAPLIPMRGTGRSLRIACLKTMCLKSLSNFGEFNQYGAGNALLHLYIYISYAQ